MRRRLNTILLLAATLLFPACDGQKKMVHYSDIYQEQPLSIYIAPLNDMAMRRAVREMDDSLYNASITVAAKQMYLSAADPLVSHGYYVPGPLSSAQIAATESRSGKQLRNENINDYLDDLGFDAILFIDILEWRQTFCTWSVVAEYVLRSTKTNSEIMHVWVDATKHLPTDYKGNPRALKDDLDFAEKYGCDFATAQRCRLVEMVNKFVLKDLPAGQRARQQKSERFLKSNPEYYYLRIERDGSVVLLDNNETIETSESTKS